MSFPFQVQIRYFQMVKRKMASESEKTLVQKVSVFKIFSDLNGGLEGHT